jgi:hypothetical protein
MVTGMDARARMAAPVEPPLAQDVSQLEVPS